MLFQKAKAKQPLLKINKYRAEIFKINKVYIILLIFHICVCGCVSSKDKEIGAAINLSNYHQFIFQNDHEFTINFVKIIICPDQKLYQCKYFMKK